MKKILFLGIASLVFSFNYINAQALENCGDYTEEELNYIIEQSNPNDLDLTCSNGTPYTNEYWEEIAEIEEEIKSTPQPRYFTNKLNVTPFKQDKNYYCGYAATKEVIHYITGSSKTQAQYEAEMKTVGQSARVADITTVLNRYTTKNYKYVLGTSTNVDRFQEFVERGVSRGAPLILHAVTDSLAMYNGNKLYHYVVATGNTVSSSYPYSVFYVDSWSHNYGAGDTFGEHLDTIANVFATVNRSGRYIIL